MEGTFCSAYNVSKGRELSLRITVADCAGDPFRLMKVILDGLAQNPDAAFWLTNLQHSPQIVRIFPLDFAYLDADLRILQGVELPPGVPLPRFHPKATSALILPLGCLAANNIAEGDQLIIGSEQEIERHLSDLTAPAPIAVFASEAMELPTEPDSADAILTIQEATAPLIDRAPLCIPPAATSGPTSALGTGSGFTLAIASTWQVATAAAGSLSSQASWTQTEELPEPAPIAETPIEPAPVEQPEEEESSPPAIALADDLDDRESNSGQRPEQPPTIDLTQLAVLERALAKIEPGEPEPVESIPVLDPPKPVLRATEDLIARSKEAAEKAYVKVAVPASKQPAKPKKSDKKVAKKEHLGNKVVRWLALDDPLPERRKIIRLLLQGLQAYIANGDPEKRYDIRDICPPGLFIRTDEPWEEGDLLSLVLVKEGATDKDHEHRVSVQGRVIRKDVDGVGVAFVFPEGTEFQPWQRASTKRSDETEAEFILRELRLARALGFLRRLCPWTADEINHALLDRFSNKRVASAVEIVLKAEAILLSRGHVAQPFVASDLLSRILEGGSWIEEDWIRRMWAGLLVSSCSADGQDRSNLPFIDLLARLTPIHLRILSFVCHRGVEALAAGETEAALDLYSTAEELMEAADSHSFPRIQQTIGQLSSVGLLAETARPSYVAMSDKSKTRTTPTPLGLKMFARCNGHR